ncbi:DUF6891 domain-containing protein [Burkholderia territorii]|uniref:DUF6891 domain-containing protein n=1 Tax=Burkholderia territorii TaxID=1503055 RepID=UPI0007597A07|nr:hypothetical protein [Burkholderia territorii]KVQ56680.1 hypothetical protein WT22_22410 [Burkholderia territorii]KWA35142.1 hypothetical protein WT40_13035 [Burkholderia territorii]
MTDNEQYVMECITKWIWSGFNDPDDVREMMEDILEPDCDTDRLEGFIESEFERKAAAERSWPRETDCDRLDRVFDELDGNGICALSNAGYTMSDGHSDVSEAVQDAPQGRYHGYCFYHGQDVERALDGHGLTIAFGDLAGDDARGAVVGRQVAEALARGGFETSWNGSVRSRIELPSSDWKRRYR